MNGPQPKSRVKGWAMSGAFLLIFGIILISATQLRHVFRPLPKEDAKEKAPEVDLKSRLRRANSVFVSENFDESVRLYRELLDWDQGIDSGRSWYRYTISLYQTGDYTGAIEAGKMALKFALYRGHTYYYIACCHSALDHPQELKAALKSAVENRFFCQIPLTQDPLFARYHDDADFQEIAEQAQQNWEKFYRQRNLNRFR